MSKIAIVSMHTSPLAQPGIGDGGGMNVYVRELSASIAHLGFDCDVYTISWSKDWPEVVEVEPGLKVHNIAIEDASVSAKEHLIEVVEEFADKVVGRLDEIPSVIHANYWLSGKVGHILKHQLEVPLVSTFHTLERMKAQSNPDLMAEVERAQAESEIMGCCDAIVASSSVEADQIVELYEVEPSRIVVVPPGVDHAFFSPGDKIQARRALGLDEKAPITLFVGRIQPLKGTHLAVEAMQDIPGLLTIVGGPSGPKGDEELRYLHSLVGKLQLQDRVIFVDPQPHELLSTFYRAADVCVVPSRSESFGLVALEAQSCGTPVVASAVGGLLSLVEHGITGYLVDNDNYGDYISKVLESSELAQRLSTNSAQWSLGYTWKSSAEKLVSLFANLATRELVECA
jgi:D-inositol-3-phosphate glycosyltransferase